MGESIINGAQQEPNILGLVGRLEQRRRVEPPMHQVIEARVILNPAYLKVDRECKQILKGLRDLELEELKRKPQS
jgi:hypothetical protein